MLQQSMVLFLAQLAFTLIREERGFKRICFHLYAVVFIFPRRGRVGFGFGFGLDFCFFCFVVFCSSEEKERIPTLMLLTF
jgi:hypothetical protein